MTEDELIHAIKTEGDTSPLDVDHDTSEESEPGPITVLDLAIYRGAKPSGDAWTLGEIERVGLPFFGGCARCGASIAAHNACPSTFGYLCCKAGCIGDAGYATVEDANIALFPEEYTWNGPKKAEDT